MNVFLKFYNAPRMTVHGLRGCCGHLQLYFTGYDEESRLPFLIPEIRQYLRALRRAWPYAVFFCDLDASSFVLIEALAHMDHLAVVEYDRRKQYCVEVGLRDLRDYVAQSYRTLRRLQRHSGLSRAEIQDRIGRLDAHLHRHLGRW